MRSKSRDGNFCDFNPGFRFTKKAVKRFVNYLLVCSCAPLLLGNLTNASTPPRQTISQVVSTTAINRPNLKIGSKGNAVNELQAALKLLGFYQGGVSGEYDNATASAVSRFRQAAGLPAANIVDTSVWQKLFPKVSATTTTTTSSANTAPSSPPAAAPVIRSTQFPIPTQTQAPNAMGVVASAPEPRPAKPSPTATQRSTTSPAPKPKPKPKPQPTKKPQPRTSTSNSTRRNNRSSQQRTTTTRRRNSNFPNFAKKPNIQYTNENEPILRVGMRGEEVFFLQQRLRQLGFLKSGADGDFGAQTESAVKALQKRFGLDTDGVVGGATWDILRR